MAELSSTHVYGDLTVSGSLKADLSIKIAGVTKTLDGSNVLEWTAAELALLPATATTAGVVKLGSATVQTVAANGVSATASRSYAVQVDSSGKMVVNVPWSDTNTVYTHPTDAGSKHVPANGTTNNGKFLMATATNGSFSWADIPVATSDADGVVKLGSSTKITATVNAPSTTASRNYPIQLDSNGRMAVNVPWVDTNTVYTHPTGDGNLHVPATGTTNNGKVLMAGAGAGSLKWADIPTPTSVTNGVYTVGNQTIGGTKTFSVDMIVNGIRIGRGSGNSQTNTVIGNNTFVNNTGYNNTAIGQDVLTFNTSGGKNVVVGNRSVYLNTTGSYNTAVGNDVLNANTTGNYNTGIGDGVLTRNTTGAHNTAIGVYALDKNTTGNSNIAIGRYAGTSLSPFNITTESNRIVLGNGDVTNAYIKVAWTVTSDERDKTEITDLSVGLEFLNNLRPVSYQFKQGGRESDTGDGITRYGFLAQQVLGVEGDSPVLVDKEQEENLKLKESNLIAVLVKAVQELSAEVELLKTQNR